MIEVIRPGQYTTIQDEGRYGYRSMGVPICGPMDRFSARLANQMLENDPNSAIIEMAFVGATFLFHTSAIVAFSGATCDVKLNDVLVEDRCALFIDAGSTLSFGAMTNGNFLYLAIRGGLKVENVLGSASFYEALNGFSRMSKGMAFPIDSAVHELPFKFDQQRSPIHSSLQHIKVERGPEFHLLSEQEIHVLTQTLFTVSRQSNRMGFRLNEQVEFGLSEIISAPVQPGTVQLTQGGQLIVLMRDAQTTGGYSRILQLTEKSIDQLAQLNVGTTFLFTLLDEN